MKKVCLITIFPFFNIDLKLGFGTSSQLPIGGTEYKRTTSLLTNKPEKVVDVDEKWKFKGKVNENQLCFLNT